MCQRARNRVIGKLGRRFRGNVTLPRNQFRGRSPVAAGSHKFTVVDGDSSG